MGIFKSIMGAFWSTAQKHNAQFLEHNSLMPTDVFSQVLRKTGYSYSFALLAEKFCGENTSTILIAYMYALFSYSYSFDL